MIPFAAAISAARSPLLRFAFSFLAKTVSKNTGMFSPEKRNTTRAPLLLPRPGRAILILRIPPPQRHSPLWIFSHHIDGLVPLVVRQKTLGRREIGRRLHDSLQAGTHNKSIGVNDACVNGDVLLALTVQAAA